MKTLILNKYFTLIFGVTKQKNKFYHKNKFLYISLFNIYFLLSLCKEGGNMFK
jgi:hypothetical protein